jgi:hypothetical protein
MNYLLGYAGFGARLEEAELVPRIPAGDQPIEEHWLEM